MPSCLPDSQSKKIRLILNISKELTLSNYFVNFFSLFLNNEMHKKNEKNYMFAFRLTNHYILFFTFACKVALFFAMLPCSGLIL